MTKKRKVSEPELPQIRKCPRCGQDVLLGDVICSRCGYDVQTTRDKLKSQPANVVAFASFALGVLIALASTGMDNPWQFLTLIVAFGFIAGGGLYYAADLLIINADDRRNKPGKKNDQ